MSVTLRSGRLTTVLVGAVAAAVFVALTRPTPPERVDITFLDVSFADSFEIEWVDLTLVDGATSTPELIPMAGADGRCIGFARTDWPESTAHPSVARCFASPQPGRIRSRSIAAGETTWHIFSFGAPVYALAITVDGVRSTHFEGSIVAATALSSGVENIEIAWTEPSGRRFEASASELESVGGS